MAGKRKDAAPPPGYGAGDEDDLGLEGGTAPGVEAPHLDDGEPIDLRLSREPKNDLGNARRLIARHGERLRYVKDVGWIAWHEGRWSLDQGERQAELLAQDVVDRLRDEADSVEEAGRWKRESKEAFLDRVDRARKWAIASGNSGKITGLLGRAQAHLTVLPEVLDAHPRLFSVANGTLELGLPCRLRPHDPRDLITMISPVAWDVRAAHAPVFEAFLAEIQPDAEIRGFLQRFLGYTLSGLGTEQALLLLHGAGANGKSTLVDLIAHIVGDYAATLNIRSLLRDDRATGSQATPDLARLPGKRFARTSEPEPNAQLAEGKIKELTGGERITARHLNEGFFEFKPIFKVTGSGNDKPSIGGVDEGIWRRMKLAANTHVVFAEALREVPSVAEFVDIRTD
jgi:putative DNA primase/helicase